MRELLTVTGITKRFSGLVANDGAGLVVNRGSIHAVVGENGAGKSTLMHIIAGLLQPDSGTLTLDGRVVSFASAAEALQAGIVMSFQHPRLVLTLTVWENLFLGAEPVTRFGTIDRRRVRDAVRGAAFRIPDLDLNMKLQKLSSGKVRLVSLLAAILRLPAGRAGILILDEPTAACGPDETDAIMDVMSSAAEAGHGVLFITHKLTEIEQVCDTVTVMKAGKDIARFDRPFSTEQIARSVFDEPAARAGQSAAAHGAADAGSTTVVSGATRETGNRRLPGDPVLVVSGVSLRDGTTDRLKDVSFAVHAGQIVGLTGNRQSGLEAVEEVLGGIRAPELGSVVFKGREITGMSAHGLRRQRIGYVPTDRMLRGASLVSSVADNLIVLERRQLQRAGIFLPAEVASYGRRLSREFDIDGVLQGPLKKLSGGNIQKVILGRELAERPELIIICEPSWGLDARSRQMIMSRIRDAADEGAAVLVLSTDVDEVLDIADVVGALYGGELGKLTAANVTDRTTLGSRVYGSPAGTTDGR